MIPSSARLREGQRAVASSSAWVQAGAGDGMPLLDEISALAPRSNRSTAVVAGAPLSADNARPPLADIQIQTRLYRCCRDVLAKLDKARSHLTRAVEPLAEQIGEVPVEPALERARACFTPRDPRGERVAEVCTTLCREHAQFHLDAGESAEEQLWQVLATALREQTER